MSSTYTPSPFISATYELMTDGDRPSAQSVRVPLERLADGIAQLSSVTAANAVLKSGGTFTLTGHVIIDAASFDWRFDNGAVSFLSGAELEMQNASSVVFRSGATLDLESGAVATFQAGSEVNFSASSEITGTPTLASSATFEVEGLFNVAPSGSGIVGSGATWRMHDSENLLINNATNAYRLTMAPQSIGTNAGVPAWEPVDPSSLGACGGWVQADVASGFPIVFPLNLPSGDDITVVTVRVTGSTLAGAHAALPAGTDRVLVSLVAVDTDGAATVLATRHDQSASVGAYNVPHSITLTNGALDSGTLPRTVSPNLAYYVVVNGATGANAIADRLAILSAFGNCTARSYRSELMTY
jgi:hypothetical protein